MPRYFFHVKDGAVSLDDLGFECASQAELEKVALQAAGDALRDLGRSFWEHRHWMMWVEDEQGATVLKLDFVGSVHNVNVPS